MIQHMILRAPNGRARLTSSDGRWLVACGRRVGPGRATSAAMTTCKKCKGTAEWDKAINGGAVSDTRCDLTVDSTVDEFVTVIADESVPVKVAGHAMALFLHAHPAEAAMLHRFLTDPVDLIRRLVTLRAEVEQLRTAIRTEVARMHNRIGGYEELDHDEELIAQGVGQILAFDRVLGLIDKQREGQ